VRQPRIKRFSNFKNTVGSLKRLAGRSYADPDVKDVEASYVSAQLVDTKGQVGARVNYLGEEEVFTSTQLLAMFLTKVRLITEKELGNPVSDVVISVPGWFSDGQRRSLMDASDIAGLNPLRLINDSTAAALGYGITKTDLPEDKNKNVCFVDIGHSNMSVAIVAFKKGQLQVLSNAYDRHFGGRNFDKALVEHFAEVFKEKYKIDVHKNPKALFRVASAVEKLKKILSANATSPLNIESLMDDIDVSSLMKREEFETLVKDVIERVTIPIAEALKSSGLGVDDIDSIELVGGSTRIPALKERISKFFGGRPLSFTLNADEAIARGCAFACAVLSPVFRVRDFAVHDVTSYPIQFKWEIDSDTPDDESELTVFQKNNFVPSTKILTFYRKKPFDLEVRYAEPESLPGKINPWIGRYTVKNVQPRSDGDYSIVKVKARINLHGIVNVENAYIVEEEEVEEPIKEEKKEEKKDEKSDKSKDDKMDTDAPVKTKKVRKLVKKGDLPVVGGTASLDTSVREAYREKENAMIVEDKLVADTEDRRNALEEYIYDMRNKLDTTYEKYASEEEKSQFKEILYAAEDWLYSDGEDATKATYIAKMTELEKYGSPIRQRLLDELEAKRQAEEKIRLEKEEVIRKQKEEEQRKAKEAEEARKASEASRKLAEARAAEEVNGDNHEGVNGTSKTDDVNMVDE